MSQKRWGVWLLYNIFGIKDFTPFWLEFISVLFLIVIAITLCSFIKKQFGDKIKIWGYIILSCILISYPLINQYIIYQPTNVPITISNLIVIISTIMLFDNFFGENRIKKYILIIAMLVFSVSTYESCAQTYLVMLFATIFIKLVTSKEETKRLWKYFGVGISILLLSVGLYYAVGQTILYVLEKFNILKKNYAATSISKVIWFNNKISINLKWYCFKIVVIDLMVKDILDYFPVTVFIIFSFIALIFELANLIKTNKSARMLVTLALIGTNFILIVIMTQVLYRVQFSWIITVALLSIYIYYKMCNKKVLKHFANILFIMLIIIQTRTLNQYFYNEYKKYEKEKAVANDIAINIVKNYPYKEKPLYYVLDEKNMRDRVRYKINYDNGVYVISWGIDAFDECGVETTNFINEQGYKFLYIDNETAKQVKEEYEKLDDKTKEQPFIELENAIVVNLNVYDI